MKKSHLLIYIKYYLLSFLIVGSMATTQIYFILELPLGPKSYTMPMIASLFITLLAGKIHILKEKVSKAAFTDPLTELLNRRSLYSNLSENFANARRYQKKFSLILLDVDNFKKVNDTFGHLAGDKVLVMIGKTLVSLCRESDYCARWGGEEFMILLPNTGLDGAVIMAEKIRRVLEQLQFPISDKVTCSFGVTEYRENIASINEMVNNTDTALYMAKSRGKNRVEVAGETSSLNSASKLATVLR